MVTRDIHKWRLAISAALAIVPLAAGHARADQPGYSVTDLYASFPGAFVPSGLNDAGQVVVKSDQSMNVGFGYVDTGGTLTRIGNLGGNAITYTGQINNAGLVVGYSTYSGNLYHAFVFDTAAGAMTDLGTLGGAYSYASGINNLGQIAGQAQTASGALHAVIFDNGSITDINAPGAISSAAVAINDSGEVIGNFYPSSGGGEQAFVYSNGVMQGLGSFGGWSDANAINSAGTIVGASAYSGPTKIHAYISNGTTLTDIGTLGGISSEAFDINNAGQIVGNSQVAAGAFAAFLYEDGTMYDLNDLIPLDPLGRDYALSSAVAINNAGQILCQSADGVVLLTPIVPAPAASAIAMGFMAGIYVLRPRRLL